MHLVDTSCVKGLARGPGLIAPKIDIAQAPPGLLLPLQSWGGREHRANLKISWVVFVSALVKVSQQRHEPPSPTPVSAVGFPLPRLLSVSIPT